MNNRNVGPGSGSMGGSLAMLPRVYGWMTAALLTTAVTAYAAASSAAFILFMIRNPMLPIALIFLQVGLAIALSTAIGRMNFATAAGIFLLYAVTLGISLSGIFLVYSSASIGVAFAVTASMFGFMSLYGYYTESSLASMGSYLLMGLVGLIVAGLVNLFLMSSAFEFFISIAGVFLFTLLTAYDTQRIRNLAYEAEATGNVEGINKAALVAALILYLDFVNLFIYILRLLNDNGRRK